MQEPPMVTGTVKWFDVKKGFGFLVNAEGKDVFVHFSSIEGDGFRALKDGERVEYDEVDSGKGLAARNVKRVKADSRGAPIVEAQAGNRGDGFAAGAPSPG
jgi:CspA family cold shock protein